MKNGLKMRNLILTQNSYIFIHKYFSKIFNDNNTKVIFIKEKKRGISKKYIEILHFFGWLNFICLGIMEIKTRLLFIFFERKYEYIHLSDKEINSYLKEELLENNFDNIISIGCPCKINPSLKKKFNTNILNVHGGILPYQKGRFSPLKSINSGHKYLGATIHIISQKFDSGEIISQSYFKLTNKNKIENYLKVVSLSAQLVESFFLGEIFKIKKNVLNNLEKI